MALHACIELTLHKPLYGNMQIMSYFVNYTGTKENPERFKSVSPGAQYMLATASLSQRSSTSLQLQK